MLPPPDTLRAVIARMEAGLLERSEAVRLTLLAALAGEHVLLIGPPGTAKSELARRLRHAIVGARYFERLLTRFSVPEELFGPLSLKALEDDRYERLIEGYLPTASVAFLDEVFKANSAILNALLTLLNERSFDNGSERLHTPLISLVGATNEVPSDEALQAFYDRFLLRVPVGAVGDGSFDALLDLGPAGPGEGVALPLEALAVVQALREAVSLAPEVRAALHALRARLAGLRITVSDRRWRQLVQLLRTQAACEGREVVQLLDLWVLPYGVAETPGQLPGLQAWFLDEALALPPLQLDGLARAVEAFERQLEIEQRAPQEDAETGKLALARSLGADTSAEGGMPRLMSATLEARLRRHYSPVHLAARTTQAQQALDGTLAKLATLEAQARPLKAALAASLWVPPALAAQVQARLDGACATLAALAGRLQAARDGFAHLPVDADLAGEAPRPADIAA